MARCPTNAVKGKVLGKNKEGNLDLNFSLTQRGGGGDELRFFSSPEEGASVEWGFLQLLC